MTDTQTITSVTTLDMSKPRSVVHAWLPGDPHSVCRLRYPRPQERRMLEHPPADWLLCAVCLDLLDQM